MDFLRLKQVVQYGWEHAGQIKRLIDEGDYSRVKGRLAIFIDILKCYKRYSLWSNQYKQHKFYALSEKDRETLGAEFRNNNIEKAKWTDLFYANKQFYAKWSSAKYEKSFRLQNKRNAAYMNYYNMGPNCRIRNNVQLTSTHGRIGHLKIGRNCTFGRNIDIDYTGGLTIADNVSINIGSVILTHEHSTYNEKTKVSVIEKPLFIGDNVVIGTNSTILAGVKEIGRYSIISAGSVVKSKVPPYAVVMGNPAKIVWFKWTPAQVAEFEKENYEEGNRINIDEYMDLYNSFYKSNIQEIKKYMNMRVVGTTL